MALPLAVLALVIMAALVAAGFAGALVEQRVGRNGLHAVQAAGAAAAGVSRSSPGGTTTDSAHWYPARACRCPRVTAPGRTDYSPTVTRLNGELFRMRVAGTRTDADGGSAGSREGDLIVRPGDSGSTAPVQPIAGRPWPMTP